MDFLQQPEIKKVYERSKYIVKLWEHNFKKNNGRLPSKLDIREADTEVRNAYRKYYQLKTQALEQSFKGVEGFESEGDNSPEKRKIVQNEPPEADEEIACDDVWGTHLNKHIAKDEPSQEQTERLNVSTRSQKLFCGTRGSTFTKQKLQKSLSFRQKLKSETSFDTPTFLSQPTKSFSEAASVEQELSFKGLFTNEDDNTVKIIQEKMPTQSINVVQSVLDNNYKPLRKVDSGWLERVGFSTGVEIATPQKLVENDFENTSEMNLKYGTDDEDIIDNSDEESLNLAPKCKKPRLMLSQSSTLIVDQNVSVSKDVVSTPDPEKRQVHNILSENSIVPEVNTDKLINMEIEKPILNFTDKIINMEIEKPILNFTNKLIDIDKPILTVKKTSKLQKKKSKAKISKLTSEDPLDFVDPWETVIKKASESVRKKKITKKSAQQESSKEESNNCLTPLRHSERSTKTNVSMAEYHSEDEDPFHSDNNSSDPEFSFDITKDSRLKQFLAENQDDNSVDSNIEENNIKLKKRHRVKKTSQKKKPEEVDEKENENSSYELEYSIKPRVAAPRFKNIKKLIKIETSKSDEKKKQENSIQKKDIKRNIDRDKLQKKIDSGSLNENFVTINLKKKVYVRGKKTMTFSKYKKQMWKNKKKALSGPDMDMGGCDGGMLTCFNCGDIGHFARHCTKAKGDNLLPLEADEEACPFPTLEEAAQMAKESVLAIRKPNLELENNIEESENRCDEESDDGDLFDEAETELLLAETLKLEEHVAKLDLRNYLDQTNVIKPYYNLKENGDVIDTPQEVFDVLKKFGHSSFRAGQEQAVMRILSGKSTLVTLSTGSGKSLCYQLPAYLYSTREPCISLVVSPLVSLMEDQVVGIPNFLKAACLHTNQTKTQREKIMEEISSGNLNILLVSPEAVVAGERSTGFGSLLRKLPPIAFACIDEAHCVSQWSHNFRPSYLMICRVLRERMGVKTVLGLTATATRATSDSIINHLQIPDGRNGIISDTPLPDNLVLTVSRDYQRDNALLALLNSDRFKDCKSIIIYCTRREECNRLTKFLRTTFQYESINSSQNNKKRKRVSVDAEPYHAGLSASRRRTIQKAFMSGELRIVVATVAFGMGINKRDIRAVIHFNMPKNFESYVQEIGRAGRDGFPAHCHLFMDAKGADENELRRHIHANSIDRHVIRKLLQKIFLPCSCKEFCPKHEVAFSIEETVRALDIPEENISTLLCYLELHEKNYIELLSPAYTVCKVISYGGPMQIRKAAKECPPLAMALALRNNKETCDQNIIEFAVVDIAAAIGWDSGICKHKLKTMEWTTVNGQQKRSTLNVQFSNLGFRLLAPGNLSDEQLDEALDSLYQHVTNQEKTSLLQLRALHETLIEVASPSYKPCLSQEPSEGNMKLKARIREYFESPNPLESISLKENTIIDEEALVNSIRSLISTYRDNSFTGRAVARILHGISSPNYPAVIWGRCKFWRSFINTDFHHIIQTATKEILNFR